MAFQDVDHLQHVIAVAEEDYVVPEGRAADVRPELGTCSAECAGQRGELGAMGLETVGEGGADRNAPALPRDGSREPDNFLAEKT